MKIQPLYLPENTNVAYQLNWSLSVFGKESLPSPEPCMDLLRESVARDRLKILELRFRPPNVAQFFVSSQPSTNPSQIVRSIKGRWQNVSRPFASIAFRRNYRITSVGTVSRAARSTTGDCHVLACYRTTYTFSSAQQSMIRQTKLPWPF